MSPLRRAARRTFASLETRNYRLFIIGQLVSLSGTWMHAVALGWLVLQLTHSGFAVGVTLALQFGPIALFGMYAGVLADRHDKRTMLFLTQSAMSVVALTLWVLTATGVIELWMIYSLAFLFGSLTALDHPVRQSFVTEMVGAERLPNAISLNSAVFNAARIFGPALAGLVIASVGLEWAFLVNAISFGAVLEGLRRMDPAELHRTELTPRAPGQIRAGLRYAWSVPRLRYLLGLEAIVAGLGIKFSVVLPLFARFVFDRGAGTFGLLTSVLAAGALFGALAGAARATPDRRWLLGSAAVFGALGLVASQASSVVVLAVLLVPIGAASITFIAAANTMLQLTARPDMRGRVMALHGIVFLGSTPIGAPLIGWISENFGARVGLATGAGLSLLAALAGFAFIKRDVIEARLRTVLPLRRRTEHLPAQGAPDNLPVEVGATEEREAV